MEYSQEQDGDNMLATGSTILTLGGPVYLVYSSRESCSLFATLSGNTSFVRKPLLELCPDSKMQARPRSTPSRLGLTTNVLASLDTSHVH